MHSSMPRAIDPLHSTHDGNVFWSGTKDAVEDPPLTRLASKRWTPNRYGTPGISRYQKHAEAFSRAEQIVGYTRTKDLDHYADRPNGPWST